MRSNDIVLTGLPRSGTTLSVHLVNKLPDCVGLHEPMRFDDITRPEDKAACLAYIRDFFARERKEIRNTGTACTRHVAGQVPDNHMGNTLDRQGLRQANYSHDRIPVGKELTEGFTLVIKHPAVFTVLLDALIQEFHCFAIIRNPLAVLASWNSVNLPVRDGHLHTGERFDRGLRDALAGIPERIDRQLYLLHWWYDRYSRLLPRERILKYEDIVVTGGKALSAMVNNASALEEKLDDKNRNELYDRDSMQYLASRLLEQEGGCWEFYSRDDVKILLQD